MQTLPKLGQSATVAGISFPLIIQSYCENTRSAFLKGENPDNGMEVLLPRVCISEIFTQETVEPAFKVGDTVRLASGSPWLTIICEGESEYCFDCAAWPEGLEKPSIITNLHQDCLRK
jgi:uncharacterized protein YodC (DUF2158 family)